MAKNRYLSFLCLQRFLMAFNTLLIILGMLIATLPIYFTINKLLKSWPINGGIIAMGVLLILLAVCGCHGTRKQHQIILFFYIVILALVSIITFAFSLAALSLSKSHETVVLTKGWVQLSNETKTDIQKLGDCCGIIMYTNSTMNVPSCDKLPCFKRKAGCKTCLARFEDDWFKSFQKLIGGMSLFVSLLMCVSVYLTWRFRHFKNPVSNPNEFL